MRASHCNQVVFRVNCYPHEYKMPHITEKGCLPHDILLYHDNFKRKEDVNLQGYYAGYMEL